MRHHKKDIGLFKKQSVSAVIAVTFCFAASATGQGLLDDIQAERSGGQAEVGENGFAPASELGGTGGNDNGMVLEGCDIRYIAAPGIYAAESGRLIKAPKEGDFVTAGDLIAETDSAMATFQWRIRYYDYEAEREKLKSDVEIRFAKAQAEMDKASYDDAADANKKVKNAVSPNQLREREFKWRASQLRIEKTLNDMRITRATAMVKHEEYKAAEAMVEMHKIDAPVTGIVEAPDGGPLRHVGEWVRPGELIAKVTQTDKLRVVGKLDHKKCDRKALMGKSVRITIPTRVEGEKVLESKTVDSKIVHIGTRIDSSLGHVEVWSEIDNSDGSITPGLFYVEMQIEN